MAVLSIVRVSELEGAKRVDAEYYQSKYHIDFSKGEWSSIGNIVQICQYGISQAMTEEPPGYPIFRMDDIENAFLVHDDVKYVQIPINVYKKYRLELNDILFNRVNSEEFVGRTGIFKLKGDYVFASYLIRLRIKPYSQIIPDYMNVFLNSEYGIRQIRKLSRRAVNQANVNAEELKRIKIYILPTELQSKIKSLCDDSFAEFEKSKTVYLHNERMVLEEIGWGKLDFSQNKWWTAPLSQGREVRRLDAEHFQPKYDKLIEHLEGTRKAKPLGEIASYIKRGLQPEYVENGDIIVVNSQHLGKYQINMEATERTDNNFWDQNSRARLEKNDVLLYSTGAYLGRTNTWLEDRNGIASNHVTIIRTKADCNPLYLSVFLNSPIGIIQGEKWASGSGQREIYPSDIARFLIYLPPQEFQKQVADLVQQSYQARRQAKALLNEAKSQVEAFIERRC